MRRGRSELLLAHAHAVEEQRQPTGLPSNELSSGGANAGKSFTFQYKFQVGAKYKLFGDCSWGDPAGSSSTVALTVSVPLSDAGTDGSVPDGGG